jgi:hypothetical protein
LLRTGHGKRVRAREVPPLEKLTRHLVAVQDQQQELQRSQIIHGFQTQSTPLLAPVELRTGTMASKRTSKGSSRKSTGRNALSASASNLANLAIHVETMGKFLMEELQDQAQQDEQRGLDYAQQDA